MKIAIILNGVSRKKNKFYKEIHPVLATHFDISVWETQCSGDAETLAARAVSEYFDIVLSAGGDGTLNQVINGILKSLKEELPAVGVLPLGTGNDFARMCSVQLHAEQIVQLLKADKPRPTDIGMIACHNEFGQPTTRYFINACSIGMGPEVVKRLMKSNRAWGPQITYLTSIVSTFFTHRPQEIHCKTSGWEWKGWARVLAIANGQSFGNALFIAPDATIDDGILNTFIAGDLSLLRFLVHLVGIKGKSKINDPKIRYSTTRQADLSSMAPCLLEAEGEMVGYLPATITLMAGKIKFFR